jgi:hypothetical protein
VQSGCAINHARARPPQLTRNVQLPCPEADRGRRAPHRSSSPHGLRAEAPYASPQETARRARIFRSRRRRLAERRAYSRGTVPYTLRGLRGRRWAIKD